MSFLDALEQYKDITHLGAFRTPAKARYFFALSHMSQIAQLSEICQWAQAQNLSVVFLGSGTNSILCFSEFPGIIVHNQLRGWSIEDTILEVASGELVTVIATKLKIQHQNPALDAWMGLPGTFGGAVFGNAGCFGLEMSQCLVSAQILDTQTGKVTTWTPQDFGFSYRHSVLKELPHLILLSVRINIDSTSIPDWKPVDAIMLERKMKQPTDKPTCGSFFRNPPGDFAGRLIEASGLKGVCIGGACVAEKHANFFQNKEGATWQDILALRDHVQNTVFQKFGILLQEEARCIGLSLEK